MVNKIIGKALAYFDEIKYTLKDYSGKEINKVIYVVVF
jgi:hypothetical protein